MKAIKLITLVLIFTLINSQVPDDKVINSCGMRNYSMPDKADDCPSDYGYCCFIKMNVKDLSGKEIEKRFCASSPSNIQLKDVKDDINDYTNSEIVEISCNDGLYVKFSLFLMLFLFYLL